MSEQSAIAPRPAHVPERLVLDVDYNDLPGYEKDFYGTWKTFQENAPHDLVWSPRNGGHWIATSGRVVRAIYTDHERFSSRILFTPKDVAEHYDALPISLDPPEHLPYRMILNKALGPKAVNKIADTLRERARTLIDAVLPQGHCEFFEAYAREYPWETIMALADLPRSDVPYVKNIIVREYRPDETMSQDEAKAASRAYFGRYIDERRGSDGLDLLTQIANATVRGKPLSTEEGVRICVLTIGAGLDTVVRFLSHIFHFLATHPEHQRQLRENPALIPTALPEMLRRFSGVAISREVSADMIYEGVELKRGDVVTMPTQLAGLDERENPNAMEVDFGREKIFEATFGAGPHVCAGRNLARLELRISLEEWLARVPEFSLQEGAKIRYVAGNDGAMDSLPLKW